MVGEIFYLFFGGAVIACLVFVLGVTVGRRVEARANPPKMAVAINDPLAALDELDANAGGELAFPAALRGQDDRPLGSVDVRAAKGQLRAGQATEAAAADVATASGQAAADVAATRSDDAPDPVKTAPEVAVVADSKDADKEGNEIAVAKNAPAEGKPTAAKPVAVEETAAPDKKDARGTKFTLQLSSFQDKAEADAFLTQVKLPGQAPYIVQAEVEGKGTWFRVRVGDYKSYDEALAAKSDFESKQKIIAYVTRLK